MFDMGVMNHIHVAADLPDEIEMGQVGQIGEVGQIGGVGEVEQLPMEGVNDVNSQAEMDSS